MILSHLFWPQRSHTKLKPPPVFMNLLKQYEQGYASIKQSRRLDWSFELGQVELELNLPDASTLSVCVTPLQACLIGLFEEQSSYTLDQMCTVLEISDRDLIKQEMGFWIGKAVVRLDQQTYRLVDSYSSTAQGEECLFFVPSTNELCS